MEQCSSPAATHATEQPRPAHPEREGPRKGGLKKVCSVQPGQPTAAAGSSLHAVEKLKTRKLGLTSPLQPGTSAHFWMCMLTLAVPEEEQRWSHTSCRDTTLTSQPSAKPASMARTL